MNKTLWIGRRAQPIWQAAQREADRREIPLTQLLTDLLERHLPGMAEEPTPQDQWAQIAPRTPAA
ncbi:hypothetical protein [Phytohabitans houttuyneae]|uniref:Uncharacterized protein n=1 Tax=Phytohabitans houttuyneae TaxID=1076126 RepID=A0A6V8K6Y9_9ACTN|nr:hypothetical protein [Phytohabitans houttuyneae]GFJ79524.1 hypothetical protein Phou_037040 [Phytohabitans houttuyneae]